MNLATRKEIKKRFGNIKIHPDGFRVNLAKYSGPSGLVKPVVQDKPWGGEVWLIFTKRYASKILYIEPHKRFSLQKHKKKEESWYVASGEAQLTIGKKITKIKQGSVIHVKADTVHRIESEKKLVVLWEVSSPELDDVVRLSDDFGRK